MKVVTHILVLLHSDVNISHTPCGLNILALYLLDMRLKAYITHSMIVQFTVIMLYIPHC
jgi:hypothetical protein